MDGRVRTAVGTPVNFEGKIGGIDDLPREAEAFEPLRSLSEML